MPQDLAPKATKLRWGDICVRTWAELTATLWLDKREVCMLTNIHNAPAEGNFCDEGGKATKPQIVMDYKHRMWIRVTEWSTVTPSASAHSSQRQNCSSIR